ncbi:hypothetical protein BN8_03495 [Fibrisoma limi BUZ 3]|uniref:HTH araC/xylS-type domain-containing protein n=1 Tax=Fibrisoma limi BUZ 3 TaxID=1185876 RepID=I2GKA8_9BACT|nr:helix-turn-helix domain-containing protein [Fibrisoma limi]CCH54333.1 hypothetical protein BN8_03495 [Fibrisoma limi BUZ 3]
MTYYEVLPALPLQPYVECYWIRRGRPVAQPARILPDGCTDVLYVFSHSSAVSTGSLLVGTMTRAVLSSVAPEADVLGIRFRPGGLFPFVQTPLHLFTDELVELALVQKQLGDRLFAELSDTDDWLARIATVNQALQKRLSAGSLPPLSVLASVRQLEMQRGQLSIDQLADQIGISRRQLERQYQQYVGVSPKLLARILRFRQVQTLLQTQPADSLMGLAFDNGYTDHAHLTKEFKGFAGITPSTFGADFIA